MEGRRGAEQPLLESRGSVEMGCEEEMRKVLGSVVVLTALAFALAPKLEATEFWETRDFERAARGGVAVPGERPLPPFPAWRFNYIHEFGEIAEFLSDWQVLDPDSVDHGGMIEGESGSARWIIQTDNTQEAIWIWCRYAELTGDTSTYRPNIDAAWIYTMNFPAYDEEGTESDYYRVHNCGWALVAESKYRQIYQDSSFFSYSDTCAEYITSHPLDFNVGSAFYRRLHPLVTGWAAGALYAFGVELAETTYVDTALSLGQRVVDWIEADPSTHLTDEIWAMSSGTAMWGVVNSSFKEDPSQGMAWLPIYVPYMDVYEPSGQWNNSWNIWYGNAYHSIFELLGDSTYADYHLMLTDTLIVQDTDEDGGVPATVGDPETMDQSWISCYLGFMGIEGLIDSLKDLDAGVLTFLDPREESVIVPGDSVQIQVLVSNFGKVDLTQVPVSVTTDGYSSSDTVDLRVGENLQVSFSPPWVPLLDTTYTLSTHTALAADQDPSNDSLSIEVTVLPVGAVSGWVRDGATSKGISSRLVFYRHPGYLPYDSVSTDSSGRYYVSLPIGTYDVGISPQIPYPETTRADVQVRDGGTTILILDLSPATLLIVDDDEGDPWEVYYTSTAESLSVSYVLWDVDTRGEFPISSVFDFATPTIVWFTGNSSTNTLTPSDQDSLSQFLDSGGNLFLTGQNIGEEISGSQFYSDYLHASFVTSVTQDHILDGVPGDPVGGGLSIVTTGSGGAGNQNSQDVISPIGGTDPVFRYSADSVAALKYDSGSYKVVYFGFGFEAVNRTANFAGRDTVLARILTWFGVPVGIEERQETYTKSQLPMNNFQLFQNYPNPFGAGGTTISFNVERLTCNVSLKVYDLSGRLIRTLADYPSNHRTIQLSNRVVWDGKDNRGSLVASGVYFYRLSATPTADRSATPTARQKHGGQADSSPGGFTSTRKMVILR